MQAAAKGSPAVAENQGTSDRTATTHVNASTRYRSGASSGVGLALLSSSADSHRALLSLNSCTQSAASPSHSLSNDSNELSSTIDIDSFVMCFNFGGVCAVRVFVRSCGRAWAKFESFLSVFFFFYFRADLLACVADGNLTIQSNKKFKVKVRNIGEQIA